MTNFDPDLFNKLDEDQAGDVGDESYIAADEPMGAHAFGTTISEEREGETFAQRDNHTLPEVDEQSIHEDQGLVGRLLQDGDEDVDAIDDEASAVATDEGLDVDMSAEESAMHITDL